MERRLLALHQTRRFRPTDPLWVLFNADELARFGMPEEAP